MQRSVEFQASRIPSTKVSYMSQIANSRFPVHDSGYPARNYFNVRGLTSAIDPRGGSVSGTEIFSSGLEKIYTKPGEFADGDPEYFNFIMSEIQGRD